MQEYIKSELLYHIDSLHSILFDPDNKVFLIQSKEEIDNLEDLFHQVIVHSQKWGDSLMCNHHENPEELSDEWNDVFSNGKDSDDRDSNEINALFIRTKKFLRSLLTIPYKKTAVRKYSAKSISEMMERAADEKAKIAEQLRKERRKPLPDEDTINNLEKLKIASDKEIEELFKERSQQELEEASEKDWSEKIKETFQLLRDCSTDLEKEHVKAETEYHLFLYSLALPSIIMLIWVCNLYGFIISRQYQIIDWMDFLPFYLPVPILIALFWVLIVQKNRAGKISIALSERLYQIKYLEGLLMTINRLSSNSQDAIETINKSLDKMVNGYLNKVAKEPMDELRVEAIEKKVINEDSYLKIINKLTDLIKK